MGSKPDINSAKKPRVNLEARRKRILDAAIECVLRSGFHGASIAEIANEADISVGVIYRYFQNKEAIIEAIVALDTAALRSDIDVSTNLRDDQIMGWMIEDIGKLLVRQHERERSTLALEIYAEAARNPKVELIVRQAAKVEQTLGRGLLARTMPSGTCYAELEARVDLLRILLDGMLMHGVLNEKTDYKVLIELLKPVIKLIVSGKS